MNRKISDYLHSRDNNFDFIRFMAALLVIFHHSFFLTPSIHEPLLTFTHDRYTIGGICVAVFFIISGFLITRSFDKNRDISTYFTARMLRIYPALMVVVFCTVFIIGPLLTTNTLYDYFTNFTTFKYYYSNTFMVSVQYWLPGIFEHNYAPKMVNGSLWTLSYELLCYCLVAAVGSIFSKKKITGIILLVLTLLVFRNKIMYGKEEIFETIFFFACGTLIYIYRQKITLNSFAALVAFVLLLVNMHYNPNYTSSMIITGIMLSYVTIFLCFVKTKHLKHFAKHGDYSYGMYIWSYLVQQMLYLYFNHLNTYVFFIVSAGITLVFAMLSWHLIEKRALKLKDNLKYKQAIARRVAQIKEKSLAVVPSLMLRK
ncbi:acyltransferase [Ilyomonas limi]|uniref:Acyltransferase n=1 Tax=Ilyomonas limi TaxID=2575867 RepID=A0A4U3KVG2_9BACT|nr:acyltransferase [Ilyomonas limi]TKK65007.1 acyltransferase [Ilyomonas limi]